MDEPQTPTTYPALMTAGTSFKVDRVFSGYAADEWKYTLLLAGAHTLSKDAVADADGVTFHLTLTPTDTQTLNPSGGVTLAYRYVERLTALDLSGEVWDVAAGSIIVQPNLAGIADGAAISHVERTLSIIEAALEGRLTADMESYSIAGRSVSKIPIRELQALHARYLALAARERGPGSWGQPVDVIFSRTGFGP